MNRRGVLGMLGIGAAAGPAVIHQYASGVVGANVPSPPVDYACDKAELWNPVEQLADARREYEYLTKDPAAWVADYVSREWKEYIDGYTSYRYEMIDPDIRSMKSLSETTKMRMYLERKARRKQQQYADSVMGRIQMLMKEV
jgi:hypothetical protein